MRINEAVADVVGIAKPGDVIVLRLRGGVRIDDVAADLEQIKAQVPGVYVVAVNETIDATVIDAELARLIASKYAGP